MARLETGPDGDQILNVEAVVGPTTGATSDVIAVQSLLKYFTQTRQRWTSQRLPEPNGILDSATRQAIRDYQAHERRTNAIRWVALDGKMSPFRRGVQLLAKQEFTIVQLNLDCGVLGAALNEDYVDGMIRRFPALALALGRVPQFL
jgi:hypothetical protein